MSYYYLFRVIEDLEEVQHELEKKGLKDIYVIEDDAVGEVFIGGHSKKKIASKKAILVEEKTKSAVDWEEQWTLFAENFTEGKAHIHLTPTQTLLLTPGAGFGDLSHPTTYLMLEMMRERVAGHSVIDIGTGSGILALSALLLGAESARGIDIDLAALTHARQNANLNGLSATFSKTLPKNLPANNIFLMNMIFPEQCQFAPQRLNPLAKLWIVSGILEKQKEDYLAQTLKWGWKPVSEHHRSEWLGFIFSCPRNAKEDD